MKHLKSRVLIALFLTVLPALTARSVLAQGGPPLITDDPGTPGDGNWEINLAFSAEKRRAERSYESPLLDINYGLGDRIQLKYEVPWLVIQECSRHTRAGLGNSELGARWELNETNTPLISAGRSFRDSSSNEPEFLLYTGIQFNF